MRPDKHKKKNHASYAKKAAQKKLNNGTLSETAKLSDKARPKARSYCNASAKDNTDDVKESLQLQPNGYYVGLSSNINVRHSSSAKSDIPTSFSQRKIESNWQQYDELPEEEENIDHRGADFMLLLTQTAGSQFRFKDEETIDEDTTETEEDHSSFISFDCNELATNLQTISLPERLEISRSVFDLETLEILDQDAATSKNLTNNLLNVTNYKSILKPVNEEEIATFDNELEDILARSHTDESVLNQSLKADQSDLPVFSDVSLQAPSSSQEDETEGRVPHMDFANNELKQQSVSNPGASCNNCSEDHNNDDDGDDDEELSFLLSLSSPVGGEKLCSTLSNKIKDESSLPRGEISTASDAENNGSHEDKTRALPVSSQNPTAAASSSDVQAESLDDWLDSILDD